MADRERVPDGGRELLELLDECDGVPQRDVAHLEVVTRGELPKAEVSLLAVSEVCGVAAEERVEDDAAEGPGGLEPVAVERGVEPCDDVSHELIVDDGLAGEGWE